MIYQSTDTDYSTWLAEDRQMGAFLVSHAKQRLDDHLAKAAKDQDIHDVVSSCSNRFAQLSRQCSRWRFLAAMENLFRVYPDIVKTVGAQLEMPVDGGGRSFLMVNNDHYEPGEYNEFCADTMEKMEAIDGLQAINMAHDMMRIVCEVDHSEDEDAQLGNIGREMSRGRVQGLMAMEAPELNAQVQALWMERNTPKAGSEGRPAPRM